MFCTKCGTNNPDGTAFCVNCGNSLQGAPPPQYQNFQGMAQPGQGYYQPAPRSNKGLIIGLAIAAGVLLIAAVVLLVLLLTKPASSVSERDQTGIPGNQSTGITDDQNNAESTERQTDAGVLGIWYEKTGYGGTITFNQDGTVELEAMGITISGTYTFDEDDEGGEITLDYFGSESTEDFSLEGGVLDMGGAEYTRDYVEQKDLGDVMDEFDDQLGN